MTHSYIGIARPSHAPHSLKPRHSYLGARTFGSRKIPGICPPHKERPSLPSTLLSIFTYTCDPPESSLLRFTFLDTLLKIGRLCSIVSAPQFLLAALMARSLTLFDQPMLMASARPDTHTRSKYSLHIPVKPYLFSFSNRAHFSNFTSNFAKHRRSP